MDAAPLKLAIALSKCTCFCTLRREGGPLHSISHQQRVSRLSSREQPNVFCGVAVVLEGKGELLRLDTRRSEVVALWNIDVDIWSQ
jgi:hypothetical protein